ncbi:MAG: hypothetical protein IT162_20670 [Bryobacterales bacterium]|nr:hypothetical protein [Bryobacterales bacterium]
MTQLSGVRFEEAWAGRVVGAIGKTPVAFIGLDEMIQNKESTGRPQDIADAATLRKRNPR